MTDTALVTGISGFVAKHVALELLRRGYHVRGTMRTLARVSGVRETLGAHGADLSRLEFVMADLEVASSWLKAAAGCRYVHHIASPFPLRQPRGREDLVPAARDGARAVLRAAFAAGAERVVLTSSMVAMMYRAGRERVHLVRETDWTDADWPRLTPYVVSKTRAERAAWDIAAEHGAQDRLVAVNPGFVLGPALDKNIGASLQALAMILRGAYPALPRVSYPVVDVRDLAALHVAAMTAQVGGRPADRRRRYAELR